MTIKIFRNNLKFNQEKINDIRSRISFYQGLAPVFELEKLVSLPDIMCLPKRDAIVWFSMYSIAIASQYNEKDDSGNQQIASYETLVTYLNKDKKIVDETFVFGSDIRYLISHKFYLYKLNSIYRKIMGNSSLAREINWAKGIPFTNEERRILSFLQQPSTIIQEIAYWKYRTNYEIALKYVYMIDRISRSINEIYKKYKGKSQPFTLFGFRKDKRQEAKFYGEIKPILTDFFDFYA